MKFRFVIKSKLGFYDESGYIKVSNIKEVSEKLVHELDYMPTEIDGVKLMDWTEIRIEIVNDEH